jgi:HCOMODA/2-hydroxy-3-carboxy-muconic semialdehyde decarboxylase
VSRAVLEDLAAAARILAAQGVVDGFGHVTMRHPASPERFLMSRSLAPALQTPDDIMEFDLDSNAVDARGRQPFFERFIHGQIYKARPDVNAVVHSHSPSVIPFGLTGLPMRAMYHNAAFLSFGVPVFRIEEKFGPTDMLVGKGERLNRLVLVEQDPGGQQIGDAGTIPFGDLRQARARLGGAPRSQAVHDHDRRNSADRVFLCLEPFRDDG